MILERFLSSRPCRMLSGIEFLHKGIRILKADGGVAPMNPNNPERKNINPDGSRPSEVGIDCFSCSHFYITYDPPFPYGCRAVGFKSRQMPSQEMLASSGIDCQYFVEKEKRR